MPIIPSTQYSQGTDITDLVRVLCNDPQGQFFTDARLLPFVNSAARRIARELANNGQTTLIEEEAQPGTITIPAVTVMDPGQQVQLSFAGIAGNVPAAANPTLPADLIFPLKLWERNTGSVEQYQEMRDCTSTGGLPSRMPGVALRDWEWRTDSIFFVGSIIQRDLRIRYMASALVFALAGQAPNQTISGQLGELDAIDAIAYWVAAAVLKPRGSAIANDYATTADKLITQLVSGAVRQQQYKPKRRKPYRGMRTRRNGGMFWG